MDSFAKLIRYYGSVLVPSSESGIHMTLAAQMLADHSVPFQQ